jgi:hypothetical protein
MLENKPQKLQKQALFFHFKVLLSDKNTKLSDSCL